MATTISDCYRDKEAETCNVSKIRVRVQCLRSGICIQHFFSILKRFDSSNATNFSLASNTLVVMMPALVQELLQFFYDIVVGLVIDQVDVLLRVIHQVIQLPEIVRRSPVRCLIFGTLIV